MIYIIGDVHGHYDALRKLLDAINYSDSDELWFCGDLVNRGPKSAEVLRFVHGLKNKQVVLGNHDIGLLLYGHDARNRLGGEILAYDDGEELIDKLRMYPFAVVHHELRFILAHAGIHPDWNVKDALRFSDELTSCLQKENYKEFLQQCWGDEPRCWSECCSVEKKWRFYINAFCRMRFFDGEILDFKDKREIGKSPLTPWFKRDLRCEYQIYFGHWGALGDYAEKNIRCIDGAYDWGGKLIAWNATKNKKAAEIFKNP